MRKHGLRAIGLCVMAALGIMAFAASAQAETGAHWNVEGSAISSTLKPALKAELENADGALLTTSGVNPVKLLCTSMEFEEAVLLANGGSLGFIKFSGCKTFIAEKEATKCAPKSEGAAAGTILTKQLKDLIILHNGEAEGYDELVPDSTGTDPQFVNIELGASCSIGEFMPVYGKFVIKDCNLEGRVEKVAHLIEEFKPLTALRVFEPLEAGTVATIDGSANVSLIGAHLGMKWSGTPA